MSNLYKYRKILQFLAAVVFYVGGMDLFIYLKQLGVQEIEMASEGAKSYVPFFFNAMAFAIALLISYFELNIFNKWNDFSIKKFLIYKFGTIAIIIVFGGGTVFCLFLIVYEKLPFLNAFFQIPVFLQSDTFLSSFIYLLVYSALLNIIKVINDHLGARAFWAALIGKYNTPVEEDRTFIFLDLNSSTSIAEKIGHEKYSKLINQCFELLTKYIYKYNAVLYQFVGDEAVLSWKASTAQETLAPIDLFLDFSKELETQQLKFSKAYGITVKFKAAVHSGAVMVTKIQSTKKEIVYHGDVLNTCARIMEQCTHSGKDMLISGKVAQWLVNRPMYNTSFIESSVLRGKQHKTLVYEVRRYT